jgi:hypothetical protein
MEGKYDLQEVRDGTEVTVVCDGIPKAVRLADNELGSVGSLQTLALLLQEDKAYDESSAINSGATEEIGLRSPGFEHSMMGSNSISLLAHAFKRKRDEQNPPLT